MNAGEKDDDLNGEWNNVVKGGKGKVNKRKNWTKNARTLTLQNFFSEHGGPCTDNKECDFGEIDDAKSTIPYLNEEEQVIQRSISSFFVDLLKRLGPLKRDEYVNHKSFNFNVLLNENTHRNFMSNRCSL